jgi:hypothetical protein
MLLKNCPRAPGRAKLSWFGLFFFLDRPFLSAADAGRKINAGSGFPGSKTKYPGIQALETRFQVKTTARSIFVKICSNICFLRIFGAEFLTETGFDV